MTTRHTYGKRNVLSICLLDNDSRYTRSPSSLVSLTTGHFKVFRNLRSRGHLEEETRSNSRILFASKSHRCRCLSSSQDKAFVAGDGGD